jgi:hypothetical protein
MRAAILLALGSLSCGPPAVCCFRNTQVARGTQYVATLPSTDGGATTEVIVSVEADGGTTLRFLNGAHEVTQSFAVAPE